MNKNTNDLDMYRCSSAVLEERLASRIDYERMQSVPYDARRFNLERMQRLLNACGNPERQYPIIHITGTKGKGSTAAMLESIFRHAGMCTGLFTSPHLVTLRERFRVNGIPLNEQKFISIGNRVLDIVEREERSLPSDSAARWTLPTYFEILTAIGCLAFAEAKVDIVLLEVGLGGRFDATNICSPELTIITSIDYDHCELLGDTLGKIAHEKAGILKQGVPLISGVTDPEPRCVIRKVAESLNVPVIEANTDYRFVYYPHVYQESCEQWISSMDFSINKSILYEDMEQKVCIERVMESVPIALIGSHQAANAACAIAAIMILQQNAHIYAHPSSDTDQYLDKTGCLHKSVFYQHIQKITEHQIRDGLRRVSWPGRFEMVSQKPLVILDGAHNPISIAALVRTMNESFEKIHPKCLIFAATLNKRLDEMLRTIRDAQFQTIFLTQHANRSRAVPIEEIQRGLEVVYAEKFAAMPTIKLYKNSPVNAFISAIKQTPADGLICVTGSFYLVGEIAAIGDKVLPGR
ncbi:MAG: bifunctional folylpolyglutamate synthase/dihydrofolate synthase [Thermoguttaceae bacterium]|nr:bifunctional folylpolyglutamate synthase/dihydrofolate synthase [Thermoguttaceae bacterium]